MNEQTEFDAPTAEDVCAERHGETYPYPCAECRAMASFAERLYAEADIADRPGQFGRLRAIANDLLRVIPPGEPFACEHESIGHVDGHEVVVTRVIDVAVDTSERAESTDSQDGGAR